jgi:hypothetical protein
MWVDTRQLWIRGNAKYFNSSKTSTTVYKDLHKKNSVPGQKPSYLFDKCEQGNIQLTLIAILWRISLTQFTSIMTMTLWLISSTLTFLKKY